MRIVSKLDISEYDGATFPLMGLKKTNSGSMSLGNLPFLTSETMKAKSM